MANPEHVEIAKRGREAIAAWRSEHPKTGLNLSGAELRGAALSQADLIGAHLHRANLSGADLMMADLNWAQLNEANLSMADLSNANLACAELFDSQLIGADLRGANLHYAELSGADLNQALMGSTMLATTDLSQVKGLESIQHRGASTIGVDTLLKFQGSIPPAFLRGCGVPEVLIEYLPTLLGAMQPIQFYSCFISHSSKDDDFARKLHARLEQEKLRVWFAPEDMRGGRKSGAQIDDAIRTYDRLLLVLSPHSIGSEWVRREIKRARQRERQSKKEVLFPIRIMPFEELRAWECLDSDSGEDLAEKVREYHIPDFSDWKNHDAFERGFAELMRDLRRDA